MKIKIFLYIAALFVSDVILAQDFDVDKQYEQAMANAKQAFEAKQYSQAVLFYREAMKIKPDMLLPKYKVEDIRTIYIENEKDAQEEVVVEKPEKRINRREQKRREAAEKIQEEKIKQAATIKMNQDAQKAADELVDLDVAVVTIVEDEEAIETESVDSIAASRELAIKDIELKESKQVEASQKQEKSADLTITARDLPENAIEVEAQTPEVEKKEKPRPKPVMTKAVYTVSKPKSMTAAEKEAWVKAEKEKLAIKYPNKKTIEEIEKPGKKITRVIMNVDGKISIYMRVKHSWGATYYFKDELDQDLKSINQQYFNLMTNLDTYAKP